MADDKEKNSEPSSSKYGEPSEIEIMEDRKEVLNILNNPLNIDRLRENADFSPEKFERTRQNLSNLTLETFKSMDSLRQEMTPGEFEEMKRHALERF